MIEIEKPRIDVENLSEDGSYGRFVVEPLDRGFGITLGEFFNHPVFKDVEAD